LCLLILASVAHIDMISKAGQCKKDDWLSRIKSQLVRVASLFCESANEENYMVQVSSGVDLKTLLVISNRGGVCGKQRKGAAKICALLSSFERLSK